jgi:effector-binding domain-containing protein
VADTGLEVTVKYVIQVKETQPQDVLCIRANVTMETIAQTIGACYGEMMAYVQEIGSQIVGPPFIVYPDMVDEAKPFDIEPCFPVPPGLAPRGRIEVRRLSGGTVATTMHTGPYDGLVDAYAALQAWVEANGRAVVGPPREVYFNGPQDATPDQYLTEVAWPIG